MKKIKFISLLIMALGMSFTSCEKDEPKDDPNAPTEETDFDIFEEISYDEMVFVKGGTFTMGLQRNKSLKLLMMTNILHMKLRWEIFILANMR